MDLCSGCKKTGENTKLKTLSCGHGFCLKCLFQITKSQNGFMPCPSCRLDTLLSLVASTRYHQLSGSLCKHHEEPLDIFCHVCSSVVCRVCTMLEHRPHHGHVLSNQKNEVEDRFRDLFDAIHQVSVAQKRLEATSNNILRSLTRTMDVIKREITDTSNRVLDEQHNMFRQYLSSEHDKIGDIHRLVKDVKKRASNGVMEGKNATFHLRSTIEKESSSINLPANDCRKYIERPFASLKCEVPKSRLSVVLSKPPNHYEHWLGDAVGILWVLPKQLIMAVDERMEGGEELCLYSFHAQDLNKVDWTHTEKLPRLHTRAVLCQETYKLSTELWFWVAAGDQLFQFTLDLRSKGCPILYSKSFCLKMATDALGVTAISCHRRKDYTHNKFLVMASSANASSLLTVYSWNGTHEEDIALGRLSDHITDMSIRPQEKSLVICDAGSSNVRSFHQETFSSLDQYNYNLTVANTDSAIPISVTCNRYGDVIILWLSSEIRKEDVVYAVWNITAQEYETQRTFVVAVGNSLETGIPTSLGCWDNDLAVCFKDGRIRILRNFLAMNTSREIAGEVKVSVTKPRKTSRPRKVSSLQHSTSHVSARPSNPNLTLRRGDTIE